LTGCLQSMEEEANQQLLDGARIVSSSVLEHEKQKEEALAGGNLSAALM